MSETHSSSDAQVPYTAPSLETVKQHVDLMRWADHISDVSPDSLAAQFWNEDLPWLLAVAQEARPLARLPYPVSSDERVDWLAHQQKLKEALDGHN